MYCIAWSGLARFGLPCLFACLLACLLACLFVCLFVCLFACLFLSFFVSLLAHVCTIKAITERHVRPPCVSEMRGCSGEVRDVQ